MFPNTRRVVVGNSAAGEAVLITDEEIEAVSRGMGQGIIGSEMWSTDAMPVGASEAADTAQREGFLKRHNAYNYVGSGQGTTFRITRWEPAMPASRTAPRLWITTWCWRARSIWSWTAARRSAFAQATR